MAVFLLFYLIILILILIWSGILTYHLLKFRYPHDRSKLYLTVYWICMLMIIVTSFLMISQADWVTVPDSLKGFNLKVM